MVAEGDAGAPAAAGGGPVRTGCRAYRVARARARTAAGGSGQQDGRVAAEPGKDRALHRAQRHADDGLAGAFDDGGDVREQRPLAVVQLGERSGGLGAGRPPRRPRPSSGPPSGVDRSCPARPLLGLPMSASVMTASTASLSATSSMMRSGTPCETVATRSMGLPWLQNGGSSSSTAASTSGGSSASCSPFSARRVGGQHAPAAAERHHGDAAAGGQRLVRQQAATSSASSGSLVDDHAGLPGGGPEHLGRARERAGVRAGRAAAESAQAAAHDDDRLARRRRARQLVEAAAVRRAPRGT